MQTWQFWYVGPDGIRLPIGNRPVRGLKTFTFIISSLLARFISTIEKRFTTTDKLRYA
jgi:hypothetical protein